MEYMLIVVTGHLSVVFIARFIQIIYNNKCWKTIYIRTRVSRGIPQNGILWNSVGIFHPAIPSQFVMIFIILAKFHSTELRFRGIPFSLNSVAQNSLFCGILQYGIQWHEIPCSAEFCTTEFHGVLWKWNYVLKT